MTHGERIKAVKLLLLLCIGSASAEVTITKPNMILVDENQTPVPGVTASTSIEKAMEKASALPNGTYYLKRPDVQITVANTVASIAKDSALLSWDAPTKNRDGSDLTDLGGFKIYIGNTAESMSLIQTINDPLQNSFLITNLENGIYYFAVTAITTGGLESSKSQAVPKQIHKE